MVGNVWEWTSTRWKNPETRQYDENKTPHYVVKGGSFIDSSDGTVNYEARNSARYVGPGSQNLRVGVQLCN